MYGKTGFRFSHLPAVNQSTFFKKNVNDETDNEFKRNGDTIFNQKRNSTIAGTSSLGKYKQN